jgi:hypothetical protein
MKNTKLFLFLLLPFFLFSQEKEKRLALVIGNSNYDKGELKNPVNDARLIASTLDSLDFDVILKENLSTKRDMTAAIREFGSRRSEYDVAFVYYAGHGVQVDDENFLLPTKETFEEEFDVMDYGVSVQNIMRYLRAQTNQVNILILDACRDNPFESSWGNTRSLKGQGLAKIPPPTGSLIAFSTDSGQTAPDGDGENSLYSISLAKNMLLKDTSIDQVFRNIRAEVLSETNGNQRPVEATQLTGQAFYLIPDKFDDEFREIDKILIDRSNLNKALEFSNIVLSKDPKNYKALKKKAQTLKVMGEFDESEKLYEELIKLNPSDISNYTFRIVHKDYSITETGLLSDIEDKKFNRLKTLIQKIGVNNNPWLLYKLIVYKIEMKSQKESDYNLEELFKISKNLQVIEKSVFDIRDYMLLPDDIIIDNYIFRDLIFNRELKYNWLKDLNGEKVIGFIESYIKNRPKYDMSLLAPSQFYMRECYTNTQRFEEYINLSELLLNTKNIYASVSINEELYKFYSFTLRDYEGGLKYLYDAFNLLENNDRVDWIRVATRIYNSLSDYLFYFSGDYIETLKITDSYISKYQTSERSPEINPTRFLIYYTNYISNLFLDRPEEALNTYKKMKHLSENNSNVNILEEQKHIMFKNKADKNYISKIDIEIQENVDIFLTEEGNIVFNLLVFKGSDESDLYSRLINEYILAHTNSANRINYFSDKYKIKPSKLKSFIWNEFYGNRNRVSKYIDNSLLKK